MNIKEASEILIAACEGLDEQIELNFDRNELTIYWKTLRIDCQPKDVAKALSLLKGLEKLGVRFE